MMEIYMKRKFGADFDMQRFVQMQKVQQSDTDVSMVQLTSNSRLEDQSHSQKTLVTMEDQQTGKNPGKEAAKQKKSERKRQVEPEQADGGFLPPIAGLPPIGRHRVG